MVAKCDFLEVVKNHYPKNRFLVTLRSFFSSYEIFVGRRWFFPVSTLKGEYFNEKMSFIVGLKKSYSTFGRSTDFGHFWLPGSNFKVDFLNVQAKFQKILGQFLGEVVRNIALNFELSISAGLRGGRVAVLQVDLFQNP